MKIKHFGYKRDQVRPKILHFGVGNFHRAHLECYTNELLNTDTTADWGICGAMIMAQDETLYKKLKEQENIYSLSICGRDGKNSVQWIGSLVELYWSENDLKSIIDKVADPQISIISMTITEGGYNLDTDAVRNDLKNPASPQSIFGIIAEGLRHRIKNSNEPVTILSCDNLQHNGDACKKIFMSFFEQQDQELTEWAVNNITFPNSMVDRITPATTPADVERINKTLDKKDECPVYCEDYLQWVVEDNFIAGRPEWEKVGVEFTDDVAPYEKMKLSLLNASHTLLSYPSFLSGYRKVDLAMRDKKIVKFIEDFMNLDVTPYVPSPPNTDLEVYKKTLIERFANSAVSDQISRLCGDGASKFPVYVLPILKEILKHNADTTRITYLLASYYHYLKYQSDDNNESFEIFEPCLNESDKEKLNSPNPEDFLSSTPFATIEFKNYPKFIDEYLSMVEKIKTQGAMNVLKSIV
ncbi:MAG: mannitol dehydrogenase family protein [Candidatus Gastranaerophilales bacterium]